MNNDENKNDKKTEGDDYVFDFGREEKTTGRRDGKRGFRPRSMNRGETFREKSAPKKTQNEKRRTAGK